MRAPEFRFRGRDGFLIEDVLQVKAKQPGADVSAIVDFPIDLSELDLYGPGKEPWKLFSGDNEIWEVHNEEDDDEKIKEKYVVTKVTRIGKKNISRAAGTGCWLDKSESKSVVLGGEEVGYRKTLTYEYSGGDGAAEGKCHYYMHELRLSEYSLRQTGVSSTDYVVCRVLRDESKCCRIKNGGKRSRCQDDDQDCAVTKRVRSCEVDHRQNQECDFEIDPTLMFDPAVLQESFDPNINLEDLDKSITMDQEQLARFCDELQESFDPNITLEDLDKSITLDQEQLARFCDELQESFDPNMTLEDLDKSITLDQEQLGRFCDELLNCPDSQEEWVPSCSLNLPDHQAFGELYSGFSSCIGTSWES